MKRLILFGLVFVLGASIGPIIIAAIFAAIPGRVTVISERDYEVGKLVAAYRTNLPPGRLFMTVVRPPDGKECGYDPEQVFPGGIGAMVDVRSGRDWADYEGYHALNHWRDKQRDEAWIGRVNENMAKDLSRFEAKFLRLCIDSTLLSSVCMAEVERYGDSAERFPTVRARYFPAGGEEDRVVCGYVDGVAARRGVPLSAPFDQKYADEHRSPF